MTQSEESLYPKLSSIYNKIMQLAIAVVLILLLMNALLFNFQQNSEIIDKHFSALGKEYSQQTAKALAVLSEQGSSNKASKQLTARYIESLIKQSGVKEVLYYGPTGQLIHQSSDASSINDLYGISDFKLNTSEQHIPFIHEVRNEKAELLGYLRLTLVKDDFIASLEQANEDGSELFRGLLVLAGIAGFFLTRGFNRFSRQGFRLAAKKASIVQPKT